MNKKIRFITTTAVCIAVLIVVQFITRAMSQFVTGSLVNTILIVSVLTAGIPGGICVAVISPFLAFLLGIGPKLVQLVPMVALGNLTLVACVGLIVSKLNVRNLIKWIIAIAVGATAKFAVLYLGIVKIVLPLIPNIPEKQGAVISASFGVAQLITAVIGGVIAFFVMQIMKKVHR